MLVQNVIQLFFLTSPRWLNTSAHPKTSSAQLTLFIRFRKIELFYSLCNSRWAHALYIGKSKIGKQYSKPTITYPIIRLLLQCSEAIGTSVQIYKSEQAGQTVFVIIPDNEKSENVRHGVAQLISKVAQPEAETNLESRLSTLESSINEIKNLLFQNNLIFNSQSTKSAKIKGRGRDSNPSRGLHRAALFD